METNYYIVVICSSYELTQQMTTINKTNLHNTQPTPYYLNYDTILLNKIYNNTNYINKSKNKLNTTIYQQNIYKKNVIIQPFIGKRTLQTIQISIYPINL